MKLKSLLFFLLFITLKLSACRCGSGNIAQEYFDADLIGIITVTKTFDGSIKANGDHKYDNYKAKIDFNQIIKGQKVNFLNVFGAKDKGINDYQGCSLALNSGEKYLVILKKDQNNEYWVDLCSRMILLSYHNSIDEENEIINRYINLFKNLEKYKNQFYNLKFEKFYDLSEKRITYPYTPHTEFIKLNISQPSKKLGIYKVFTDKNNKIKQIIPIKKIGEKDKKIEQLILKNLEIDHPHRDENKYKESLLLLYFDDFEHFSLQF